MPTDEIMALAEQLERESSRSKAFEVDLECLEKEATELEVAFGGSWLGHHSRIYYRSFQAPPAGAHFSVEWGTINAGVGSTGDWVEYEAQTVREYVFERCGNPSLEEAIRIASEVQEGYFDKKADLRSILHAGALRLKDSLLDELKEEVETAKIFGSNHYIEKRRPKGSMASRDTTALMAGQKVPPHIRIIAEAVGIRSPFLACERLSRIALRAARHIERLEGRTGTAMSRIHSTRVFIGHGGSSAWRDLKDFVNDRLKLQWDEYDRVSSAGIPRTDRLSTMLEEAGFAFLVLTAEDETATGKMNARLNVIHEAGLFQGRLGFQKAIILLEEGCEEFSNIHGLGQIRFPDGNISAKFEEIRKVLEREGIS